MSAQPLTPVQEYRQARALLADALRRGDRNAVDMARPIYLASLERLKAEDGAA